MTVLAGRHRCNVLLAAAAGCLFVVPPPPVVAAVVQPAAVVSFSSVVPAPVSTTPASGVTYTITAGTTIYTEPGSAAVADIAGQLATILRRSTGYPLPIANAPAPTPSDGIALLLSGAPAT